MTLWKPSGIDPVVESRAAVQARWLVRDHGDAAEDVLAEKMGRRDVSPADRYRYRLIWKELKRLRKSHRAVGTAVTVWQPRLFSADRLMRLFGVRAIDRRRRPR